MYTNMLNAAVRALKAGEKVPDLTQRCPLPRKSTCACRRC